MNTGLQHGTLLSNQEVVMDSDEVSRVRAQIERYRRGRHARAALPAEIWADAAAMARRVGTYAAARALGVSYDSLRAHVDDKRRSSGAQRFVELEGTTAWPLASEQVVEIVDVGGAKLTIHGGGALDVAALVRAFRREAA